ncbi:MAG: hypothetical protein HXX18_06295 [Bacteroidetes bacterium]|nr:hypothetical protein [Bacteroidota bacterium]
MQYIKITELKLHFVSGILLFAFILILAIPQNAISQNYTDSIKVKTHSPRKASIYSALLPGMGQVYNHQYWKVPVLYAGIATLTYFFIFNTNKYNNYKDEYLARINNDSIGLNAGYSLYSDNTILLLKNYYQRNLEFTYIVAGLVYLLNIIDASVYAHLFTFDVGNDLSLRIDPMLNNNFLRSGSPPSAGLKLTLRF